MSLSDTFSLALQAFMEIQPELEQAGQTPHLPPCPSLPQALAGIEGLPPGSLFLGVAEDGLPLLLDLDDPAPGAILVAGDSGSGKTAFLQTLAAVTDFLPGPGDLQFTVLTGYPEEWAGLERSPNNLGIWPVYHQSAARILSRLVSWAGNTRRNRQKVLLLVDDISRQALLPDLARDDLAWLLLHGPGSGIWPVASIQSAAMTGLGDQAHRFRTRIFGHVGQQQLAGALTADPDCNLNSLFPGMQFMLQRRVDWLPFWIPTTYQES